jgi:4,5-DOPA dioxygenase extradiol
MLGNAAGHNHKQPYMDTTPTMPALFVGHGTPMNALDANRYTRTWAELGQSIPRPRAVLAISAHWYINATAVTAMARPKTIHDFYGFPEELFAVDYPAPGDPDLASEIIEVVRPTWVGSDTDSWGIDHGTWSVLTHMYPDADIPVVQLAIDATKDPDYHIDLGASLAPLRNAGVLIVASGNVAHNLRYVDRRRPDYGFDWAVEFDQAATELMTNRPFDIGELMQHQHYDLAAPTPDHLIPLYYTAGLAAVAGIGTRVVVDGYAMGSLSMTTHILN